MLKLKGKPSNYTDTLNKLTSSRDLPTEVVKRLRQAGFVAKLNEEGILAVKK